MNQPSITIPNDTSTIPPSSPGATNAAGTSPNSPLTNLFARLSKSGRDRKNAKGAFGGKTRSKRHAGLV